MFYNHAFPIYGLCYRGFKAYTDRAERRLLKTIVSAGDVVVDAGANIGIYSKFLFSCVGPKGVVHSFEPAPEHFKRLQSAMRPCGGAQPTWHFVLPQVAAEQFQTAVRGQLLLDELDGQLPLDQSAQARYAQSHQRGLLCGGSGMGMSPSLKSAQEAFLFHQPSASFMPQLFSDWG